VPNPGTFLYDRTLKPETVRAVEAAGQKVSQVVARWAGGHPKLTKKLEAQGIDKLLKAARDRVEQESVAEEWMRVYPDTGWIEALQMYDLDPNAPPPIS